MINLQISSETILWYLGIGVVVTIIYSLISSIDGHRSRGESRKVFIKALLGWPIYALLLLGLILLLILGTLQQFFEE